ncbi:MAG: DUF6702 family protein [Bacteroidota bacterium]
MTLLIQLLLLWLPHPIHVSVTEAEYNEKTKSLQIISRIFIDDLELSIQKQVSQESLDILEPRNGKTTDQLLGDYLNEHLKIKMDGKPAKINYLAHEVEDLAIICYLEIENVKKLKTLEVTNTVIQETHADQSNIVHITYKGPVKSYRLTSEKPTETFKFETK